MGVEEFLFVDSEAGRQELRNDGGILFRIRQEIFSLSGRKIHDANSGEEKSRILAMSQEESDFSLGMTFAKTIGEAKKLFPNLMEFYWESHGFRDYENGNTSASYPDGKPLQALRREHLEHFSKGTWADFTAKSFRCESWEAE